MHPDYFEDEYEVEFVETVEVEGDGIQWADVVAAWEAWKVVSFFLSAAVLAGIIYSIVRYNQIRNEQKKKLESLTVETSGKGVAILNERWQKVLEHSESGNPSDWRLAILEADIMLEEMMTALGYNQDTLGEKLKAVNKNEFVTVDKAWEAHKVRNEIAHTGSDFALDHREVRRVIELYKEVFQEFHFI